MNKSSFIIPDIGDIIPYMGKYREVRMRNTGLLAMVLFIVFVLSSCATGFIPSEEETGAYVQFSGTTETDD